MPPARRKLRALGSLQLIGYANNPAKVITELAFIADQRVNSNALTDGGRSEVDMPLEVQFNEFMDGVNSRGKGTKTRQRKMTIEQAAAVLLVTVQKGHVELITKTDDPHTIDVIKILPGAKQLLATFLPKLRGYGDVPYDDQYRGAIALAKRHFFPKGSAPTKKELMALLLQSYQEKRQLRLQCQTRPQPTQTLGIQTSLASINGSSHIAATAGKSAPDIRSVASSSVVETPSRPDFQSTVELPNSSGVFDVRADSVVSDADLDDGGYDKFVSDQTIAFTPAAPKCFNPYMTPVSNPRQADQVAGTSTLFDGSPTAAKGDTVYAPDEDGFTDEGVGELLQATATSEGRLNYYYSKFVVACQKITFLEGEREDIERKYDLAKKRLEETEHRLREANADRSRLKRWVDRLVRGVNSVCVQLSGMTDEEAIDGDDIGLSV